MTGEILSSVFTLVLFTYTSAQQRFIVRNNLGNGIRTIGGQTLVPSNNIILRQNLGGQQLVRNIGGLGQQVVGINGVGLNQVSGLRLNQGVGQIRLNGNQIVGQFGMNGNQGIRQLGINTNLGVNQFGLNGGQLVNQVPINGLNRVMVNRVQTNQVPMNSLNQFRLNGLQGNQLIQNQNQLGLNNLQLNNGLTNFNQIGNGLQFNQGLNRFPVNGLSGINSNMRQNSRPIVLSKDAIEQQMQLNQQINKAIKDVIANNM